MSPIMPVATVTAAVSSAAPAIGVTPTVSAPDGDFGAMLQRGVASMDAKVAEADRMVARFALDDNVPIHHVTIAIEEARLAVELAMQVRQRVVESYRELMNMQL